MQSISILDIKEFMHLLLQTDCMDGLSFVSAVLQTDMQYTMDGHIQASYFSDEERAAFLFPEEPFLPWRLVRDKFLFLIRGHKTPSLMKIVFRYPKGNKGDLLFPSNLSPNSNDIEGAYLNIVFQNKKLNVICGISYSIFTLDRSVENEFVDDFVTFLKSNKIAHQL